ncbi:MAG TPA: hypothetical protein VEM13_00765 [Gemmatimonadales bacterium]|nr:hypothetical protein [Gemmatimonadales bacterium]
MSEPFLKILTRNTLAAAVLGAALLFVLPRHGSLGADFVDTFTLAFCFTFLGRYVDAILLALPNIQVGLGRVVRVAGWFAGGLWCYVIGRWLWVRFGRDLNQLPALLWGGVFLVVLELIMNRVTRRQHGTLPE